MAEGHEYPLVTRKGSAVAEGHEYPLVTRKGSAIRQKE
jgi:hypothetical protein